MTKVSIMSDLHLEFAPIDLPGGDVLILAGDIWLAREMKAASWSDWKRDRFRHFCKNELSKYARVLVVTGNHEHYGFCIDETDATIREFLAEHAPNARLLVNEAEVIEGVTFLGTPLWSTCGVGSPVLERAIGGGMNDFKLIRTTKIPPAGAAIKMVGKERVFTPRDAARIHRSAIAWLRAELPRRECCVVIGHHAPSMLSAGGHHYGTEDLDLGYCSNQHGLIEQHPQIKMWIHGHTHREECYQIGQTRIVANPRGYFPDERRSRSFDPTAADFLIEDLRSLPQFPKAARAQ